MGVLRSEAEGNRLDEEITDMLRTIFAVGLMAILGLIALKFIFGIFGFLFAVLFVLFVIALKIALVGFIVYLVIRILSPETARRIRQKWSGA
jgi:predicted membrane metal-binding protein